MRRAWKQGRAAVTAWHARTSSASNVRPAQPYPHPCSALQRSSQFTVHSSQFTVPCGARMRSAGPPPTVIHAGYQHAIGTAERPTRGSREPAAAEHHDPLRGRRCGNEVRNGNADPAQHSTARVGRAAGVHHVTHGMRSGQLGRCEEEEGGLALSLFADTKARDPLVSVPPSLAELHRSCGPVIRRCALRRCALSDPEKRSGP
jgi:hypothetical protein